MIRFIRFTTLAAIILTSTAIGARAQEGLAPDASSFFPPGIEHEIDDLPLGGTNLLDGAYTTLTICDGWPCAEDADTVCIAESADSCHIYWEDTRAAGHTGKVLFVNGHRYLSPRLMEIPLVRYGANLNKGVRYKFTMRSRNICGWCEDYPEMNGGVSINRYTEDGTFLKHLVSFRVENDWVEYSVEFTAEETGRTQIDVFNTTGMWTGNDMGFDAKLTMIKPPHIHDEHCGHKQHKDEGRDERPRPGHNRR